MDATKKERAKLQEEKNRCRKELHEAHETLQSVHERRQKLEDEKAKHRIREADWEKEKERLEAQIDQLNESHSPEASDGGLSERPSDRSTNSGSVGLLLPGNEPGDDNLKDEIQKLQTQLRKLRDELTKAEGELKDLRMYKKRKEDRKVFRARLTACETENEKLDKYGGTLDRESCLYQTLKKLADFHDANGPEPTTGEYAQIRAFEICIAERRRIMAQARRHLDPRGFMTPYLDKWDNSALAGGCTFIFNHNRASLKFAFRGSSFSLADAQFLGGSTLTARMKATRLVLDKLATPK